MAQPGEPAGNLREIMSLEIGGEKLADDLSGPAWRLNVSGLELPEGISSGESSLVSRICGSSMGNKNRIAKYYKKQEKLLKDFIEMESLTELGYIEGAPTKVELAQVARNERMAINISNIANLVLFVAKVYLSISTRSLAVIASTLDSLLDLLSGFILWFTSNAMKKPDKYMYPIGKMRMQPVGIIVFASAMATLGVQILLESGQQLLSSSHSSLDHSTVNLIIGVMSSVTVVKFALMIYCQSFKNEIVKAYAQDHLFDVITNSIGLATAILAINLLWWIDPVGAIVIALYTMGNWAKTVLENVRSLVGKSAPPNYLAKLTYLIWNHHEEIKHIDTVRAYTFGFYYFVEVDIVLHGNMLLSESHDIGETLQMKLEQLPEVERAFVHVDFEFTHKPEHKTTIG